MGVCCGDSESEESEVDLGQSPEDIDSEESEVDLGESFEDSESEGSGDESEDVGSESEESEDMVGWFRIKGSL